MKTVEVYRLWSDGHWDKVNVEVEPEPWTAEIVESRAVSKEWMRLAMANLERPIRMGLFTLVMS